MITKEQQEELQSAFTITDQMRDEVTSLFSHLHKSQIPKAISKWMLDDNGHAMEYVVDSNLSVAESYQQRKANCLTFTILFHVLAREFDVDIAFNSVDIPDTWGLDEELGMVFYRHVNGVYESYGSKQIYDLALNLYSPGYPQRYITNQQALGLLENNKAVEFLSTGENASAEHSIKLAISLDPKNPDFWANLGVVLMRSDNHEKAKSSFNYALTLNPFSIPAIGNLERLYTLTGEIEKSNKYAKRAVRARNKNPYHHYKTALQHYDNKSYVQAMKYTKKAIKLHNKDPRFYEIKSLISQQQYDFQSALESLKKAYVLSSNLDERDRYMSKADLVVQNAIKIYQQQPEMFRYDGNRLTTRKFN